MGLMSAAATLFPLGRLHYRPIQRFLLQSWLLNSYPLDKVIKVPESLHPCLLRWTIRDWLELGTPLQFRPQPCHSADASLSGWGALLLPAFEEGRSLEPVRTGSHQRVRAQSCCSSSTGLGEQTTGPELLLIGNTVAVAYIKYQGGTR